MTPPPGLTCAKCQRPFEGRHARTTDDGYTHADTCRHCCTIDGCDRPHHANGLCAAHNKRRAKYGNPLGGGPTKRPLTDDDYEDLEFMAATGENLTGAARRLDRHPDSLFRSLKHAGRLDLYRTLNSREGDWNAPTHREAVIRTDRDERNYQATQRRLGRGAAA